MIKAQEKPVVVMVMAFAMSALVTAGFLAATHRGTKEAATPSGGRPLTALFDASQELLIPGQRFSRSGEASTRTGYEVVEPSWMPSSVESHRAEVWFSAETNEAGLRYGEQLVLTFRQWPPNTDAKMMYEAQAREWSAGTVSTLRNSFPAWIIPAESQGPGAPPVNVIHLSRGGVDITLYGLMTMEELTEVAESLP